MNSDPVTPAARISTVSPVPISTAIDPIMAFGMSRLGSFASSAARATPSTPRKNQMPNGNAARSPLTPKGRAAVTPSFGAISNSAAASKCGAAPNAKAASAIAPTTVITSMSFKASPTPKT